MYANLHNRKKIIFSFLPSSNTLGMVDVEVLCFVNVNVWPFPYTSPSQELSLSKLTLIFKPAPRCHLIIEYIIPSEADNVKWD